MKRLVWLALLAGACSGDGQPRPARSVSLPPGRNDAPPPAHTVVAWVNDRPITRDALLDSILSRDYKRTVDLHVVQVMMEERKRELGIAHTDAELKERARLFVAKMKDSNPEGFAQSLQKSGRSEPELVEAVAGGASLKLVFGNEKALVYDLLSQGYSRVDIAFVGSIEEADRYHADPASVKPREMLRDVRLSPLMYPAAFRRDLVDQILQADPADPDRRAVRAALRAGPGAVHVTVRERVAGRPGSYAALQADVLQEVLRRPPDTHELEMWANALFAGSKIKYDDRWYSPGN